MCARTRMKTYDTYDTYDMYRHTRERRHAISTCCMLHAQTYACSRTCTPVRAYHTPTITIRMRMRTCTHTYMHRHRQLSVRMTQHRLAWPYLVIAAGHADKRMRHAAIYIYIYIYIVIQKYSLITCSIFLPTRMALRRPIQKRLCAAPSNSCG